MNKIYRVVWNETTQTWNAVAEFAKAHGKTASSGIGGIVASAGVRFAFTAIMSGLLLASGQAMATAENNGKTLANGKAISAATEGTDYNTCYFDTTSYNVVCGDDTTTALDFIPQDNGQPPKQGKSVSIGQGAQTSGESNVAIGPKTVTANTGSIAIGVAASANHNQSIAMGQEASAKGEADVSIGKLAGDTVSSDGRNIAIGESALKGGLGVNNVIAIGSSAGVDSNSSHSVYIGTGATGKEAKNVSIGYLSNTKSGSIAVGDNSNAQGNSSVAIGTKSVVTDVAGNGVAIGFNSTTSGLSAVAIGGSSSIGKGANASGPASLAIMGTAVASAQRAISIGEFTVGSGAYGIAIGGKANAQGTSSIAIGGSQATDKATNATGNFSTAIGYGAKTVNHDTTAVGKNSTANGLRATAFGVDSNAGAENALAAGPQTTASAKGAIAVGFATQATGLSSIAVGKEAIATTETSTSLGQNSQATANNAVAIGNKAVAAGTGNIVVGTNAGVYDATVSAGRTVGADTVYIGADSGRNAYTNERQISIGKGTGNNATGVDNIALGLRSGAFVSGANNVAIGREAGMGTDAQKLSVTSTVAIGEAAKGSFSNTVAIGKTALAEKESAVAVGMVSKASGDNSVAIGKTANASAHETVAIGHETVAGAVSSVAVGQRANASGSEAVALGIDSNASGKFAVAIGNMAKVTDSKLNGIAIGSNAVASEDYAMAMGLDTQATGNSSIAFGNTAKALGKEAVAFGHLATAAKNNTLALGVSANSAEVGAVTLGAYTKADAVTGTALGYSAHAVNENDVALGGNSLTEAHHNGDYTLNGNYTAAGTSSYGTVSVGSINTAEAGKPSNAFTRQIQNVSAGVISATSTDAINGSQLYATNSYLLNLGKNVKDALGGSTQIDDAGNLTLNNLGGTGKANVHDALEAMNNKIDQLGGGSSSHFYSVNTASDTRGNYNNNGATGLDALAAGADAQAAGDFAVAVGTGAQAVISNSIAIGKNASVNEDTASDASVNGLTKGEGSVAIGANTKASGTNATAVGQSSNAYGQNSFAGGQSSKALGKSSVAVGDGAQAIHDSTTAIGAYSQSTAAGATALGFNTRATAFGTVAAGRNSKAVANNALALGNEADAQKDDTIAIGYNAQATQNRAVAFGKNAKATAGDTFALGDSAKASVGNAIAFGKNANAAHAGSIALGANSATEAAVQTTSATVGGLTFGNFAGNTPESTLSIGTAGKERTITNVAAGRISNNSTDAVNGSQLYATQNVMNNIGTTAVGVLGGNAAIANDGTITMSNIGGTGASTIEGAISAINDASYKSFKLNTAKTSGTNGEANNHSLKEITNGSTITLEAGKNIVLNQNESTVSINTADAPEFAGKITAKGGLDMSNTKITNLGKGDQPTDAVNLSQLTDAINNVRATTLTTVTNDAPFAYVADDGKILKRNVTVDGSGAKQVSFVYADDASTPYNGNVTIAALNPTDSQTTVPTTVGNVAAGKGQNDAVNVSQLDKVAKALGTSVNSATGEIAAPKYSVISGSPATSGVADYNDVGSALTALSNAVRAPLTFAGDSGTPSTRQLGSTVAVKGGEADATKLSDSNNIGVVSDDVNGTLNVKLAKDLQGLNSARFDTDGSSTTINGGNVTLVGKDGEVNASTAEGNTLTDQDGNTTKSIAGITELTDEAGNTNLLNAKGIELSNTDGGHSAFKADGSSISDKNGNKVDTTATGITLTSAANGGKQTVSLTQNGLNNGGNKITNVAKGTEDNDAVNVAQLNEQLAATEKTTTVVAGKNVTVSEKVDGNNTEYTVNADKTTLSQAANGAVKVSEGAKDADGVTDYALDLTDEAKADIAKGVAAKDAVDNKGLTFAGDNGTTGAKKLGDSLSVKGDGNILTRADENGISFSLADKITVGKAGKGNKPLVIDGTAGLISGLSNTTLGGADFATKGQAASEEQLNATQANLANLLGGNAANDKGNVTTTDIGGTGKDNVHDAIAAVKETADKGWNLNANDETSSEKIGSGDTVTFKEGKNVKVSRNGKNITVATSDDVSFDKVTVGGSVLTDNGLTVGNGKAGKPVSLTKDGLNNGGNKVSDIAAGEADTDAVNVAQLKAAAAKATSKVDSGNDNIVVTPEQNADGSTTYKVATAPNLKADSFTAGDTVVNKDGVKVGDKVALDKDGLKAGDVNITADGINAGNKAISNVAEGKKDTDAVNVGQLNRLTAAAKTEVEAGTNIASVSSKQGANKQTVYTINADGASVSAGSDKIVVTKGKKDANNVTDYAVDLSKAVKDDIAKGVAAKDAVDNKGISFAGDSGTTVANKLGDTVAVKGDVNITTTAGANGIQVGLNKDLKVDSVKAGDTVVNNSGVNVGDKVVLGKDGLKAGDVNITAEGINAGGKKVTNVAAGTVAADSTDAVNGSQLYQANQAINQRVTNLGNYVVNMGDQINQRIDNVESDSKAGTAAAMAVAGLPQAYLPGKSMMAVAGGVYRGESGYAVGFSSISDGGNWVIKGTATGNSRGHYGATAGVGYQW